MPAPIHLQQMYTHTLNPLKGWPSPTALDFTAGISVEVTNKRNSGDLPPDYVLHAGMVCSLHPTDNKLVPGVRGHAMPLFIFQGELAADVYRPNPNDVGWIAINPSGRIACLVATGAYELETTEFVDTLSYQVNDLLRSPTKGANAGKLTNANAVAACDTNDPGTNSVAIVGVVSRPPYTNAYGRRVIAFWPVWYPGRANEPESST
ncbi:MAG: hypothetical protein QXH92_04180 [Candidatus Aenigmatarchaeota archaeon]